MALNFLKSEENLSWDFLQKCGFNYMPITQRFSTYKKILNNIFLNSLYRIPKIIEILYIVPAEKPD